MFPPSPLIRVALALAAVVLPLKAQNIVYSVPGAATSQYPSLTVTEETEYASAVHLTGTDRLLDSATVAVYSNVARTAQVTFSLYAAIPETRYPASGSTSVVANLRPSDTALWTSGPTTISFTSAGPTNLGLNQLIFSGINTLVPDNVFWAITFDDITNNPGTKFGPKFGAASSVTPTGAANDPSRIYMRSDDLYNGIWTPATIGGSNLALAVTLKAVPEASTGFLVLGAASLVLVRRRRR